MPLTDDPSDPRLTHYTGPEKPAPQAEVYLVLSEEERAKGFVRPLRRSYIHRGNPANDLDEDWAGCMTKTHMGLELCETYARDPKFYGATYCVGCRAHFPVSEFIWAEDGEVVGS